MFGENLTEESGTLGNPGDLSAADEPTDRQLLDRFVRARDEAAFAAIVQRHGPMVLAVCRRVLTNPEDADDAFQATFLVLVHKADALLDPDLLAGWLYGVAYRTAQNARAEAARRSQHERRATPVVNEPPDEGMHRLLSVLDEELQRLPDKYRAPLVLCYPQGKTHVEAARQLGWPVGSMSARLARGRTMLRNRLTARQQALLVAFFSGIWVPQARAASVPRPLADTTVRSAVGLAREEGRRRAMAPSPSVSSLVSESLRALSADKRGGLATVLLVLTAAVAVGSGIGYATGRPAGGDALAQPAVLESPPPSTVPQVPVLVPGQPGKCKN